MHDEKLIDTLARIDTRLEGTESGLHDLTREVREKLYTGPCAHGQVLESRVETVETGTRELWSAVNESRHPKQKMKDGALTAAVATLISALAAFIFWWVQQQSILEERSKWIPMEPLAMEEAQP